MSWKNQLAFLLAVCLGPFSLDALPAQAVLAEEAVESRALEYRDERRLRPVAVEVWYPSRSFFEKAAALPLIVMSHGHRGDRHDRSWLAKLLARRGYLVASVEHYGNTPRSYNPLLSLRFWERPLDISFALDALFKDPWLQGKIDPKRIGFVGYSLGGMTGLALAGAVAKNVKEILFQQRKNLGDVPREKIEELDVVEAEKNYKEPRIRAFLLLCPAVFIYAPETLQRIKAPIGLIATLDDEVLPHKEHAYAIMRYAAPKKLQVMPKGTSHYVFLDAPKKGAEEGEPCCPNRASVQERAAAFALEFFNDTLKSR